MTDDRPTDPTSALDGASPPDQWDEITARAAEMTSPIADDDRSPRRVALLTAGAAVALVALVIGAIVLTSGDDGEDTVAAAPSSGAEALDDPSEIWGRVFVLTRLTLNRGDVPIPARGTGVDTGDEPAGGPIHLDLRTEGAISFTGCNSGGGPARLEGDRLSTGGEWSSTAAGCFDKEGQQLMEIDEIMADLFLSSPTVELRGDRLVLSAGATEAELVDREAEGTVPTASTPVTDRTDPSSEPTTTLSDPPDGAEPSPGEIVNGGYVADGDADCVVGVVASGSAVSSGDVLVPGPADPPVLDWERQDGQGLWHSGLPEVGIEVRSPGTVVTDLVGERTEEVALPRHGTVTVWHGFDGWVQVRVFPGEKPLCASFDVTVRGPTDERAREVALEIADRIVTAPR